MRPCLTPVLLPNRATIAAISHDFTTESCQLDISAHWPDRHIAGALPDFLRPAGSLVFLNVR